MATRPPKNAEYLYKFRGVSNLRWLIDIIMRQRLYAASYDELNDPMEGYFLFDSSSDENVRNDLRKQREKTGICYLSEDYKNTLMWAFYGENHKGVCIKLAVTSDKWTRLRVKYEDKLPLMTTDPKGFEELLSVKSKHWGYEKEVRFIRIFEDQKKMRQSRFVSIYIDGIYFGYKMNEKDVSYFTKLFSSLLPYLPIEKIRQLKRDEIDTGFNNI